MDTIRIKFNVSEHNFDAEGPTDTVNALFLEWKGLVAEFSQRSGTPIKRKAEGGSGSPLHPPHDYTPDQLMHIFKVDDKQDLVTIKVQPTGESRYSDALLLVLYGFQRLKDQSEVVVTKLKPAVESSGFNFDRLDRLAIPYVREGYLVKGGSGKGGKYRLTNKGIARAEEMIDGFLAQLT